MSRSFHMPEISRRAYAVGIAVILLALYTYFFSVEIRYSGVITNKMLQLRAPAAALVQKIMVEPGSRVVKGQVLAQLQSVRLERERQAQQAKIRLLESQMAANGLTHLLQQENQNTSSKMIPAVTELAEIRKDLELIQQQIAHLTLRAPYDGVVAEVFAQESEWVDAVHPVISLGSMEPHLVHAYSQRKDLPLGEPGLFMVRSSLRPDISSTARFAGHTNKLVALPQEIQGFLSVRKDHEEFYLTLAKDHQFRHGEPVMIYPIKDIDDSIAATVER